MIEHRRSVDSAALGIPVAYVKGAVLVPPLQWGDFEASGCQHRDEQVEVVDNLVVCGRVICRTRAAYLHGALVCLVRE